jgi:hypothetical protein
MIHLFFILSVIALIILVAGFSGIRLLFITKRIAMLRKRKELLAAVIMIPEGLCMSM